MSLINTSLKGKVALITGGSKGIGRAIALAFAEAGADVAIVAREKGPLESAQKEIEQMGYRCLAISADLSIDDEVKKTHVTIVRKLGAVDILVNNAGMGYFVTLADITYNQFNEVMRLNTWSCIYLAQLCHPGMKEKQKGVIINIASTGGIKPDIFVGAYSASKSALIMLTKQMACEWGDEGLRCVAICPGLVRTEMAAELVAHREVNGFQNLVNRVGEPEEVAGMALLLASAAGSYCQGAVYLMDGGSTVNSAFS